MDFFKKHFVRTVSLLVMLLVIQGMFGSLMKTARADGLWDSQVGMGKIAEDSFNTQADGEPVDIRIIVANVVRVFCGLLGLIFVVLLILAGYKWMMAGGDSSKVSEAMDQMRTAVIGLLIIFATYGITIFVMRAVLNATNTNLSF